MDSTRGMRRYVSINGEDAALTKNSLQAMRPPVNRAPVRFTSIATSVYSTARMPLGRPQRTARSRPKANQRMSALPRSLAGSVQSHDHELQGSHQTAVRAPARCQASCCGHGGVEQVVAHGDGDGAEQRVAHGDEDGVRLSRTRFDAGAVELLDMLYGARGRGDTTAHGDGLNSADWCVEDNASRRRWVRSEGASDLPPRRPHCTGRIPHSGVCRCRHRSRVGRV